MFRQLFIIILSLLIPLVLHSQSSRDSLSFILTNYESKNLSSHFEKQLNTYNLNSHFKYNLKNEKLFFGLNEHFQSTVIKSTTKSIKDAQSLSLIGEYQAAPIFKIGMLINNSIYSDDRKLDINQASNLNSSLYTKLSLLDKLAIIPFGGLSINRQIDEDDRGFIYGSEAFIDKLQIQNFEINSAMKFQNEDISPRKNTIRLFNVSVSNDVENVLNNTINANYSEMRKDFYFEVDSITSKEFNISNNIQSRTESNYLLRDRVYYSSPASNLAFDLQGGIKWRNIDRDTRYKPGDNFSVSSFDTKIDEFRIDLTSVTELKTDNFGGIFKVSFAEREEKHLAKRIEGANEIFFQERALREGQKNNKSQQLALSVAGSFNISNKDNFSLSLFHRKLIYDTPSDENFDDRDELLTMFRLYYVRSFNPFFNLFLSVEGSVNHIVYLFAERSSNNNIKRILKLSSGGDYRSKYFNSQIKAEVSANYTVFDFEDISANFRSYSFRQLTLKDSSALKIERNVSLILLGYLKLSEQGDFKWTNFTSKPVRFLKEMYAEPKLFYKINALHLGIGIRYFSLSTFGFKENNERIRESVYSSLGPLAEIIYLVSNRLKMSLYGWYEFIITEETIRRELANMNLQLTWHL